MADRQPDILLIMTDQQRFDTCGSAKPPFLRTPHMDILARDGVTFARAYADCPLCVPARAATMTGRHSFNLGRYGNFETSQCFGRDGTLPTRLRELGYQTAAVGKMHFGPARARHGFDEMLIPDDYYIRMRRSGEALQPMRHGVGQNEIYPTMATVPEAKTLTSWIAEESMLYIRERRDPTVPFFLFTSFSKPHPPLDPPEPYYSMYRASDIPEPVVGEWAAEESVDGAPPAFVRRRRAWSGDLVPPEVIREARAAYYGLVTQIDYNIGRILSALQDLGIYDETVILFCSDHGEFLGDQRVIGKFEFLEPASRVPFVLRMPRSFEIEGAGHPHGIVSDALVTHADILPTLLRAAGGEAPPGLDGTDLIGLVSGESEPRAYLEACFADEETAAWNGITDGRWKYVWYPEGPAELLFDLEADPKETRNLAGVPEHEKERARLHAELTRLNVERRSPFVKDGKLAARPARKEPERDTRSWFWAGFHTEFCDLDVKH